MGHFSARRRTNVSVTPVITAGGYTTGDALGGLMEFKEAVARAGGSGSIKNIIISDAAGQSANIDVIIFNQSFTATADNAAINISAADVKNIVGILR